MPVLRNDNFARGMSRDRALAERGFETLRTLKNFDIDYEEGRLVLRKGYERFNEVEMPSPASQIFLFIDDDSNEHVIAICQSPTQRWYEIKATGAHTMLVDEMAIAPSAIVNVKNRLFFATNNGWYWTDDNLLGGVTPVTKAGIPAPSSAPGIQAQAAIGHTPVYAGTIIAPNTDTYYKLAQPFTLTQSTWVASIQAHLRRPVMPPDSGNIRFAIYNNSGGLPTSQYNSNAVTDWYPVANLTAGVYAVYSLPVLTSFELPAGNYHLVMEADGLYRTNYNPISFFAEWGKDAPGTSYRYWNSTSTWVLMNAYFGFAIGGIEAGAYGYVITYYNSEYGIESRPSAESRISVSLGQQVMVYDTITETDPQIDKLRAYRRELPAIDAPESAITDVYRLVGEVTYNQAIFDTVPNAYRGAELQTQGDYPVDDPERSTEIVPYVAVLWKSRIWMVNYGSNVLWFTKVLEEDGASGLVGDPIYDVVPEENRLEVPEASWVNGLSVLGNDQLAVYFTNGAIWNIWGGDEPLNPPSDLIMTKMSTPVGLIGTFARSPLLGRDIFLSREGVYSFGGSQSPLEINSDANQSILDDIEAQYLKDSVMATMGTEIWLLVDMDNDGTRETIMIYDFRRNAWRIYEYDVKLNFIAGGKDRFGSSKVIAADAGSNYLLNLNTGDTDNGKPITGEIESHNVRAKDKRMIHQLDIDAKYVNNPGSYTVIVTDHMDVTKEFNLNPTSSDDIRGHRTGIRYRKPVSVRLKLLYEGINQDEILSLALSYKE